jgi:hypothetical protein
VVHIAPDEWLKLHHQEREHIVRQLHRDRAAAPGPGRDIRDGRRVLWTWRFLTLREFWRTSSTTEITFAADARVGFSALVEDPLAPDPRFQRLPALQGPAGPKQRTSSYRM